LLLAGKHVLVEKPLTTRSTDAEELIELSESRFATLMVGHTFVFNAGIRKVKEYVKDRNGRVYYLTPAEQIWVAPNYRASWRGSLPTLYLIWLVRP